MVEQSMFNWRLVLLRHGDLSPNAKYVALYLSTFMNEWGDNCFPSIARIVHETGLSKPTVVKYLSELREKQWLISEKRGIDGKAWAHNQYYPMIPDKAVKEINHQLEGGKNGETRRLNSEDKAVKQLNPNSTENSTKNNKNTTASGQYTDDFETAWKAYPKRSGDNPKSKAYKAWRSRIRDGATAEQMLAGVQRYAEWVKVTGKEGTEFVMQAIRFFGPSKPYEQDWTPPAPIQQEESWQAKAKRLGINPKPGESEWQWRNRVEAA